MPASKHQGWDREKYNAYQRLYMAIKRLVKAGKADWWPRKGVLNG